jgi:transposase
MGAAHTQGQIGRVNAAFRRRLHPHAGDLYVFRGRRGDLLKILWHDGIGMSLYSKRLERGRFTWPTTSDGVISISAGQLGFLLEGIDWRNPQYTFRPETAG